MRFTIAITRVSSSGSALPAGTATVMTCAPESGATVPEEVGTDRVPEQPVGDVPLHASSPLPVPSAPPHGGRGADESGTPAQAPGDTARA